MKVDGPSRAQWVFLLGSVLLLGACVSAPLAPESNEPAWIRQSARTVDNGYIVYVSMGEDRKSEVALFKAEATAIQDVANECSFPPKGTRIEDRFDQTVEGLNRYYIKIALSFDDCDAAKAAVTPKSIHKLANAQLTEQLKKYEDLVSAEAAEEMKAKASTSLASSSVAVAPDFSESAQQSAQLLNGQVAPPNSSNLPIVITNQDEYFATRQQIAYMKETVILAPPSAYPPHASQTTLFIQRVEPATTQVQTFEHLHPEIRSWSQSWSRPQYDGSKRFQGTGSGHG